MNLLVAPKTYVENVEFKSIPVEKIIGMQFLYPSQNNKEFCCIPVPVVIEVAGQYELLSDARMWEPELKGKEISALFCYVLPKNIDESTMQMTRYLLEVIHANRSLIKGADVVKMLVNNSHALEIIQANYGQKAFKVLPELLLGNSPSERHIKRLVQMENKKRKSKQVVKSLNEKEAELSWKNFCSNNDGVWTFGEIISSFPKDNEHQIKKRLIALISESGSDLHFVWEKVSQGLKEKGVMDE